MNNKMIFFVRVYQLLLSFFSSHFIEQLSRIWQHHAEHTCRAVLNEIKTLCFSSVQTNCYLKRKKNHFRYGSLLYSGVDG